jgi:hypothetical protein
MKLFRYKSNLKTIVKIDGKFATVIWTESMERGFSDCSWMVSIFDENNLIPLTDKESKIVLDKRDKYGKRRPFIV